MSPTDRYVIFDWAGNRIQRDTWPAYWGSWEDAEEALSIALDDAYETDRGEYYIELVKVKESV